MQKVPLDRAEPGMILARPIKGKNGQILVAESTKLDKASIERLERMGVSSIMAKGRPLGGAGKGSCSNFRLRARRLDHLFRNHNHDKYMMFLKRGIQDIFIRKAEEDDKQRIRQPEDDA